MGGYKLDRPISKEYGGCRRVGGGGAAGGQGRTGGAWSPKQRELENCTLPFARSLFLPIDVSESV